MPKSSVFTILGSGFGMYGYLPALVESGLRVALPERYRATVGGRSELARYASEITWCADSSEALMRATGAILAVRPADQVAWVSQLAEMPDVRKLILEKPVAPTPQLATTVIAALEKAGKRYRVGYTFRFLPWARRITAVLNGDVKSLSLEWTFLAHHYRFNIDTWKRFDASGGGALRFYGIHLIALLAGLGYDSVTSSVLSGPADDETSAWQAVFEGAGLPPFSVLVDSRSEKTAFRIVTSGPEESSESIVDQPNPFALVAQDNPHVRDPRVDILMPLIRSLLDPNRSDVEQQRAIISLWSNVEAVSGRRHAPRGEPSSQ